MMLANRQQHQTLGLASDLRQLQTETRAVDAGAEPRIHGPLMSYWNQAH